MPKKEYLLVVHELELCLGLSVILLKEDTAFLGTIILLVGEGEGREGERERERKTCTWSIASLTLE